MREGRRSVFRRRPSPKSLRDSPASRSPGQFVQFRPHPGASPGTGPDRYHRKRLSLDPETAWPGSRVALRSPAPVPIRAPAPPRPRTRFRSLVWSPPVASIPPSASTTVSLRRPLSARAVSLSLCDKERLHGACHCPSAPRPFRLSPITCCRNATSPISPISTGGRVTTAERARRSFRLAASDTLCHRDSPPARRRHATPGAPSGTSSRIRARRWTNVPTRAVKPGNNVYRL